MLSLKNITMAFQCSRLIRHLRCIPISTNFNTNIFRNSLMSTSTITVNNITSVEKDFKADNNIIYLDDPDTFGTLSRKTVRENVVPDEGDIKEEKYLQELPLQTQKLTTRQYADLIKQYMKHKRLKEALDVLEVRMLQEDRVKPENYIYNILIGACADVGYTKKAFKLYNDMKKRALKPTGDTYTSLFTACLNSPWILDGLNKAKHLRALMIEKGIEPNLTNYNVMIKAFGRCGDLPTAFKIVDEMISKKIKIRVHTFNHLLHACITDKEHGLRHALVVWRKMLKMREKPNVYSFNLMLKCVKDCNLGNKEDINDLIGIIEENMTMKIGTINKPLQVEAPKTFLLSHSTSGTSCNKIDCTESPNSQLDYRCLENSKSCEDHEMFPVNNEMSVIENQNKVTMELVGYRKQQPQTQLKRTVPNLLSRNLNMEHVFALKDIHTLQDKFAVIGGQEDFLKEMEVYSVKPDIKIFTQMLPLIDDSTESELNLIEAMQIANVKADIDFYNLLIKKRSLRMDYEKALEVRQMIKEDAKKRHPLNKKQRLKENIMTYGVLALTCRSKESAVKLLEEMKEKQVNVNAQILGTLLKHGTVNTDFDYIKLVLNVVREEKVMVNEMFLQHLETFIKKCGSIIKTNKKEGKECEELSTAHKNLLQVYKKWKTDVDVERALKQEHPWQQFKETYPETVQRTNIEIKQPKKFYKRNRKYVMYAPQVK